MRSMHASRVRGPTEIADRTRDGQQHASRKHMMQLAGYSTPDQPGRGSIGPTDTQETQRTDTLSGTVTDWSTNRKVMGGWEQTEQRAEALLRKQSSLVPRKSATLWHAKVQCMQR